jgi:site-specific DNA recombinase
MDELHTAIAAFLRRQRSGPPAGRRPDPRPAEVREVAIYARVATVAQGAPTTLDMQVAACRAFAASRGETVGFTFREVAEGLTLDRPRLAELRAVIAHGWVSLVLVTGHDRLTRDRGLLLALTAEWAAVGVAIVVVA